MPYDAPVFDPLNGDGGNGSGVGLAARRLVDGHQGEMRGVPGLFGPGSYTHLGRRPHYDEASGLTGNGRRNGRKGAVLSALLPVSYTHLILTRELFGSEIIYRINAPFGVITFKTFNEEQLPVNMVVKVAVPVGSMYFFDAQERRLK